ncbi:MAG TPA: acyl-CoA dehydrogenase family protein [Ilumatobacteraceae bacterium]
MDFELDDDERALQEGVRTFLAGRATMDVVRANEETGGALDRTLWNELAQIGVFSLREDGFGMTESVLAFEELGRALVPGPLVATHLAAGLIDGAAAGTRIVGLIEPSEPVVVVEHIDSLDDLLVLRDDGVHLIDPATLDARRAVRPLDPLTPVASVSVLPPGHAVAGADVAARWRRDGMVLTAALQLGICLATIELGRAYAMEREQFGRPIGSFQAVKHMLADMLTRAEVTRAAVYAAGVTIDGRGDGADPMQTARTAKILAGDSALFCAKTCIQVHGGMGFTWEVHAQRYWKRACVLDTHFGNSDHHAAAFADAL